MMLFQRALERFEQRGARVIGASCDSQFVQRAWAEELGITYPMLADPNREAARAFDVLIEELSGIRDVPDRAVFIIDREGRVRYRWMAGIKGQPDVDEVLRELDEVIGNDAAGPG
ncbi:MAG TPA: redoxin domain-containing protein [Bacillota bacterium]